MAQAKKTTRRASTSKAKAAAKAAPKKAAATKRTTTRKASTSSVRRANVVQAFAHWPEGTSPYAFNVIPGKPEKGAKGAVIIAAMVVTGYASLAGKATTLTKGKGGNPALLKRIVGNTAYNFHRAESRIDKGSETLNVAGLNWFNARLAGMAPQNNTDVETVRAMIGAMTKGGKAGGLEFTRKVAVEA